MHRATSEGGVMDEASVREHAQAHGQAMVEGDINRAGSDLTKEAMATIGPVMKAMPRPVTNAEIQKVEAAGDEFIVDIRYTGDDSEVTVRSRWIEESGRPKVAEASIA